MGNPPVTILLVEPDLEDARLVQEMLHSADSMLFKLVHTQRLAEGLQWLVSMHVDVVLIDLSVPDTYGISNLLRVHDAAPHIPIVVMSRIDDDTLAMQAVQAGAQDYLVKGHINSHFLQRSLRYAIERQRVEERIEFLAHHDLLTSLPNRLLFYDRLNQSLAVARRNNTLLALLFLDLDRFKHINDTLGHDAGDQLLQAVTQRLTGCVRETDTVARLGGDEFTFIISGISCAEDAARIAQKVLDALVNPFVVQGYELHVTSSIGISLYPLDGSDAETLVKNADTAMYRAKDQGRNKYQLYTASMNASALERLSMENSLRHALVRGELVAYYQPQIQISTGQVVGLEALVRWQHPTRGLLMPGQFLHLAEDTGLILPLGQWMLHTACAQIKTWQQEGIAPARMAVNISLRQFQSPQFVENIMRSLSESGVDASALELEMTEGIVMHQVDDAVARLRSLRQLGVHISIDDFGTGYSSLSYLKQLPINTLKIDRSFVRDLSDNPDDATNDTAIIAAIIALAHTLKLEVVAEGVETSTQLTQLNLLHCDNMQGYLLSRPMPADRCAVFLRQRILAAWHGASAQAV